MREVINEIEGWLNSGKPVAIATNVRKEGSTLRPLGAKMAMNPSNQIAGSVTGGCIEAAVYEEAQGIIPWLFWHHRAERHGLAAVTSPHSASYSSRWTYSKPRTALTVRRR